MPVLAISALSVSIALTAATSCAADDGVRQAAMRDVQHHKQLVIQREREIRARDQEIQTLNRRLDEAETERASVQKALANAMKSMEDLARSEARSRERAAEYQKLAARFGTMIDAGTVRLESRDNRMLVSIGADVLFAPGRAQLGKGGAATLQQITSILREVPDRDLQVAGHTDSVMTRSARFRSTWDVSSAQAVEVVRTMVASGMEAKRLFAAGYGAEAPIGTNETSEGRARNRRIEIVLMPKADELPTLAAEDVGLPPQEEQVSAPEAMPQTSGPSAPVRESMADQ